MSLTDVSYCNDFLTIINTQEGIWNSDFQPRCSRISENIKWKVELLSLYVGHLPLRFFFNHLDFKPLALSILQKKILKFQLLIECCNNFDWSISVPNSIPFCQKWCQKYHLEKWKHSCYPKIEKQEAWFANIFSNYKKVSLLHFILDDKSSTLLCSQKLWFWVVALSWLSLIA